MIRSGVGPTNSPIFIIFAAIALEREVEGDLILGDMGQGMPFRAASFDGAISISALQWLCNADKSSHDPSKRLYKFFSTLFSCLSRSARAVFQFYPENSEQIQLVTTQATKAGFYGGVVVDFPNSTKAKKYFLVLMTGGSTVLPQALGTNDAETVISHASRRAVLFVPDLMILSDFHIHSMRSKFSNGYFTESK